MAYTINDLTGDEQSLLGQNIKIEAIPQRLFYPKQEMSTLEAGSFGLLSVDVSEVKDGAIPECFNIGWGAGERFYNITVKGKLPRLMPDVHYSIIATLVSHPQYGLSYQIVEMNRTDEINTVDEEKEFIYYVFGNELASVFYAVFDNPFKLFIGNTDKAIEELSRIKGIKYKKAANLLEKFKKNAPNFKAIVYLQGKYGLSPLAVSSLVAQYKSVDTVIAKIEENPYVLTEVDGWGFARCDKVALAKGISAESPFRIEAFVRHDLNQIFDGEGHTWVLLDRLAQDIRTIAPNIENKKLSAYFQDWVYNHDWLYYDKQTKRIGLRKYYTLEYNIAEEFKRLLTAPVAMYDKQVFADVIKECEEENGWEYTEEQKVAIYGCMDNNVYLITARAGSGKTVSMKPIARYAKKMGLALGQVSLAGKAASNLSENTGEEGSTIHRFLGYRPEDGFLHDKNTPVRHDIIILDELSLVGLDIFCHLIQAIKDGAHLIMLGDSAQLEAIGGGNLIKDCLESNVVPNKILTKIHRQAQRSAIITESLKVSDGQQIVSNTPVTEVRGELKDLKVVTYNSSEESQMKFIGEYKKLLEIGILPNDILGVVPMKSRGSLSCLNLNKEIQKIVNGDEEKPSIKVKSPDGEYELRLGDKIVNRKNHYDTESIDGEETPIYNGNVGYVTEVGDSYIVVDFTQWGKVIIPKDYILDVNLGYVLTAHSAQGSQSPYVIVGLDMSAYVLLSKEWEYTALTRARKYCVLCGQISAIRKATTISRVSKKQTFLKELLRKSIQQL